METEKRNNPIKDQFFLWYRNGTNAGSDIKEAEERFYKLPEEKQKALFLEYKGMFESQERSSWTGPFDG